jgi:hypothetical protein
LVFDDGTSVTEHSDVSGVDAVEHLCERRLAGAAASAAAAVKPFSEQCDIIRRFGRHGDDDDAVSANDVIVEYRFPASWPVLRFSQPRCGFNVTLDIAPFDFAPEWCAGQAMKLMTTIVAAEIDRVDCLPRFFDGFGDGPNHHDALRAVMQPQSIVCLFSLLSCATHDDALARYRHDQYMMPFVN